MTAAYTAQPSPFTGEITALATNVEYLVNVHTPLRAKVEHTLLLYFGLCMTLIRHNNVIASSESSVF